MKEKTGKQDVNFLMTSTVLSNFGVTVRKEEREREQKEFVAQCKSKH